MVSYKCRWFKSSYEGVEKQILFDTKKSLIILKLWKISQELQDHLILEKMGKDIGAKFVVYKMKNDGTKDVISQ